MRSVVSSLRMLGELNSVDESESDTLTRRAGQRRQILTMMALSYTLDAFVLILYAMAGATGFTTAPLYLTCALLSITCFVILSDIHFNDRFKDHYLVVQQMGVSFVLMLAFIYIAPEVGSVFLCSLFVIVALGALRSTLLQIVAAWTVLTVGLAVLFLATDIHVAMPVDTPFERFATLFMFSITLGRCMVVGMFSSALRESFYNQGLALREAYQRIEELAELDELTGALNRRSIMRALDEEIERSIRLRTQCSIALIDLDWFKKINDRFGHPVGDETLRTFAITMFANIRAIDKFGRYGGEEFLLILPDASNDVAAKILDRLRKIVAGIDWDSIARDVSVTISAGVATLQKDESADSLLARADTALYRAKDYGRNRIEAA
jgi:diguanylate cyclase (GGDEF)-like protein